MYCRYCGKEIEDDSIYCQYCGKKLTNDFHQILPINQHSIVQKFNALSKNIQYIILAYCLWFLLWMLFLIINADEEKVFFPVFLFAIVIPFTIFCIWFVLLKNRHEDSKSSINSKETLSLGSNSPRTIAVEPPIEQEQESAIVSNSEDISDVIKTELLLDFAKEYGKMQVVKKSTDEGICSFCTFTSNHGVVEVFFSPEIGHLTADEIAQQKYYLCVKTYKSGKFELTSMKS